MTAAGALAGAVLLAAALDWRFGEPPDAWHPVAWLGRVLSLPGQWLPGLPAGAAFLAGTLAWFVTVGAVGLLAWWLQALLFGLTGWLAIPLLALVLKPAFAWRMLHDEVGDVETTLRADDGLAAGRERLARLCSRRAGGGCRRSRPRPWLHSMRRWPDTCRPATPVASDALSCRGSGPTARR